MVATRVSDLEFCQSMEQGVFDRILVDAPCSGIGVIRRNPDIKWDPARQHLLRYQSIQLRILDCVCNMIKPGGMVLYSVCSFEPEENEMVIQKFLNAHAEFTVFRLYDLNLPVLSPFLDENGFFRSLPHLHHMDGFFCAGLRKAHA
jgi:16S rRNA (cytosine967-C5)-methyltransferase